MEVTPPHVQLTLLVSESCIMIGIAPQPPDHIRYNYNIYNATDNSIIPWAYLDDVGQLQVTNIP